jgi:hypothetical protein
LVVYRNIHNQPLETFDNIQDFYHSWLNLGALAEAYLSWWEQTLKSGLRGKVQPRDVYTLGVVWGGVGVEVVALGLLNG